MEAGGDRFGRRPQGGSTSGSTDRFSCDILDCHAHSGRLEEIGDLNVSPHNGRLVLASDGRTLMVAEWGDAGGFPVFWLHGSPGSRFSRHYDEREYSRAGARVITYDRPGYGGSDREPGRRVVSCVGDIAAIADALGIEQFAVMGGSGGGRMRLRSLLVSRIE